MTKNKTLTADDFFDQKMMDLMNESMAGKVKMCEAAIKIEGLVTFIDYRPQITKQELKAYKQKIESGQFDYVTVYPRGDKFVISLDYKPYYIYKELGLKIIPCQVLGEAKGKYVVLATEGIKLPKIKLN